MNHREVTCVSSQSEKVEPESKPEPRLYDSEVCLVVFTFGQVQAQILSGTLAGKEQ